MRRRGPGLLRRRSLPIRCVPASAQSPGAAQCSQAGDVHVLAVEQRRAVRNPPTGFLRGMVDRNCAIPVFLRVSRWFCSERWCCSHGELLAAEQPAVFPRSFHYALAFDCMINRAKKGVCSSLTDIQETGRSVYCTKKFTLLFTVRSFRTFSTGLK